MSNSNTISKPERPVEVNLNGQWARHNLGKFAENPSVDMPFDVYVYPDLLDPEQFNQVRSDAKSVVRLKQKDNDLYKFKQSKDMRTEITTKKLSPTLNSFIDAMLDQVRLKLEKTTGLSLSSKYFDITVSRYNKGDYLLCHNDDIKDAVKQHRRALAFIFYLNSRPWTRDDGGSLILYDSDKNGEPVAINNTIEPKPNTLIVFKTSSKSWHSVEEVLCNNDVRLSINGWFHTLKAPKSVDNSSDRLLTTEPSLYHFLRPVPLNDRTERFFKECVSGEYLMEKTCYLIRRKFKKKSEINLTNFLVKEKYDEISQALRKAADDPNNLTKIGPYNKRNYKILKPEKLPEICRDLYEAFRSELFFLLLSRLTGLDLQPPSFHLNNQNDAEKVSSTEDDDDDDEDDDDDDDDDSEQDEDDVDNLEDHEESSDEDTKVELDELKKNKVELEGENSVNENILEKITSETRCSDDLPATSIAATSAEKPPKKRKKLSDPISRMEFRHLEPGSYTIIHDHAYELAEKSALDVILHFNHDFSVNFEDGGYISYLDVTDEDDLHDMDCELLTIEPKSNCLSLAYRCDEGTCRFLKYMTKSHPSYQDLYCVYYEKPDDLPRASDAANSSLSAVTENELHEKSI